MKLAWRLQVCSEGHLLHPHSQHELVSTPVHTHCVYLAVVQPAVTGNEQGQKKDTSLASVAIK